MRLERASRRPSPRAGRCIPTSRDGAVVDSRSDHCYVEDALIATDLEKDNNDAWKKMKGQLPVGRFHFELTVGTDVLSEGDLTANLGALGGLLADFGYDVYAVSSMPDLDARPAFEGWVGGGETSEEHDELVALDVLGLSIGGDIDGLDAWSRVEPDDQPSPIDFVRVALDEIRRLTGGSDLRFAADLSVRPSTGSDETTRHVVV